MGYHLDRRLRKLEQEATERADTRAWIEALRRAAEFFGDDRPDLRDFYSREAAFLEQGGKHPPTPELDREIEALANELLVASALPDIPKDPFEYILWCERVPDRDLVAALRYGRA